MAVHEQHRRIDQTPKNGGQTADSSVRPMRPVTFLGLRMHPWTMAQTVDEIDQRLAQSAFTQHVVVNVAKLVRQRENPELRAAIEACDIVNIDGMGVVWGARLLGLSIPERVAGIDLFFSLLALAERRGHPVFLLGARPEALKTAVDRLATRYPDLRLAGSHHGYFWDDEEAVVSKIRASRAKLLFVAVDSPKKEKFINRWKHQLGVGFAMGVGGTFDVVAGVTHRAPVWMQRAGLEWFFRLIQEPGRMWKRYLFSNAAFVRLLVAEKLRLTGPHE